MPTRFADHILKGTLAARPAASAVPAGTVYSSSTDGTVYQSDGSAWGVWLTAGGSMAADTLWDAKGDLAAGTGADAAARVAVGTDGQILVADSSQSAGLRWGAAAAGDLTLLSTSTLGASGTFDVSSISGSYSDLLVVLITRGTNAAINENLSAQFNGDTAAHYDREMLRVSGNSAAAATQTQGSTQLGIGPTTAASSPANTFGVTELHIYGYASTTWNKTTAWQSAAKQDTTSGNEFSETGGGLWVNTAALTRVQVFGANTTNLAAGSQMRIYGRR